MWFFGVVVFLCGVVCGTAGTPVYELNINVTASDWADLNAQTWADNFYPCQVTLQGKHYYNVTITLHGGFSRTLPKKSYELRFYGTEPKLNFFQYPGDKSSKIKTWLLGASVIDPTFLRQKLLSDTLISLGALSPRIVFGDVSINGNYYGFYLFEERINDDFINALGWSTQGNLYKSISHDGNFLIKADPLQGYSQTLGNPANSGDVGVLIQTLQTTPLTYSQWSTVVSQTVSLSDWLLYNFVQIYGYNQDGFDKNYYMYHDPASTAPFRFISWDMDSTYGNDWTGNPLTPPDGLYRGWEGFSNRLFAVPEYLQSYLLNMKCLIQNGELNSNKLISKLNADWSEIQTHAETDYNKWTSVYKDNYGSYDPRTPSTQMNDFITYLQTRGTTLISYFDSSITSAPDILKDEFGLPLFNCGALRLHTLVSQNITIVISEVLRPSQIELYNNMSTAIDIGGWYITNYVLNKTKFQIPLNTMIPAFGYAIFTLPFSLGDNEETIYLYSIFGEKIDKLVVPPPLPEDLSYGVLKISTGKFRPTFFVSKTFGSANSAPYLGPLVINEIHYKADTGDYEFVVIKSVSSSPTQLFLTGNPSATWSIKGTTFSFPSGTTIPAGATIILLIGNYTFPFKSPTPYPIKDDITYFTTLTGKLDDSGEEVSIQRVIDGMFQITLDIVEYESIAPWPEAYDGISIIRRDMSAFGNDPQNWELGTKCNPTWQVCPVPPPPPPPSPPPPPASAPVVDATPQPSPSQAPASHVPQSASPSKSPSQNENTNNGAAVQDAFPTWAIAVVVVGAVLLISIIAIIIVKFRSSSEIV